MTLRFPYETPRTYSSFQEQKMRTDEATSSFTFLIVLLTLIYYHETNRRKDRDAP